MGFALIILITLVLLFLSVCQTLSRCLHPWTRYRNYVVGWGDFNMPVFLKTDLYGETGLCLLSTYENYLFFHTDSVPTLIFSCNAWHQMLVSILGNCHVLQIIFPMNEEELRYLFLFRGRRTHEKIKTKQERLPRVRIPSVTDLRSCCEYRATCSCLKSLLTFFFKLHRHNDEYPRNAVYLGSSQGFQATTQSQYST